MAMNGVRSVEAWWDCRYKYQVCNVEPVIGSETCSYLNGIKLPAEAAQSNKMNVRNIKWESRDVRSSSTYLEQYKLH
jgi:hypothetical protein